MPSPVRPVYSECRCRFGSPAWTAWTTSMQFGTTETRYCCRCGHREFRPVCVEAWEGKPA